MTDHGGDYGGVLIDGALPRSESERCTVLIDYAIGLVPDAAHRLQDEEPTYRQLTDKVAELTNEVRLQVERQEPYEHWNEVEDQLIQLISDLLPDPWYCTLVEHDPGTVIVTDEPDDDDGPSAEEVIVDLAQQAGLPVSILALAKHRLGRDPVTGGDFEEAGLAIIGGCAGCGATLAAYNAYPSKTGYWLCSDCIGSDGWADVKDANADIFQGR